MKISVRCALVALVSAASALAQPTIAAVGNGFSFQPQMSPGVLATVVGANLAGTNPTTVTLNGLNCPVTFTSATQLNIQVPWEAAVGAGHVTVTVDGQHSSPFAITLTKYSPAIAVIDGANDGSFVSGSNLITSTNKANGGDVLLTAAVGLGETTPAIATGELTPPPPPTYVTLATPTMQVAGAAAKVAFSGLYVGILAVDQVNFTVPANTPVGSQPVTMKIGGVTSPSVNIPIGCQQFNSSVSIKKGPLKHTSGNNYTQTVMVQNTSTGTLPAKGSIILTTLTSTAQLTNGGGATCPSSDGSPFKTFSFTGTPQTANISLHFTSTSSTITYGVRVLAP